MPIQTENVLKNLFQNQFLILFKSTGKHWQVTRERNLNYTKNVEHVSPIRKINIIGPIVVEV